MPTLFRRASRAVLVESLKQVARLPLTRKAIHRVSVAGRGCSVAFIRVRRVLPDSDMGRSHLDRQTGGAMLPRELERALVDMQRTLRFVHAGEAVRALRDGHRLPEGMAVLTFDESFAATAELALPILKKLGVPALFFVTTEALSTGRTLWDQEVENLVEHRAPHSLSVPWIDQVLKTDSTTSRATAVRRLLLSLVALDESRIEARLHELYDRCGGPPRVSPLDRMLNAEELSLMAKDPLVSIGAHGHRHYAMAALSDDALRAELKHPRDLLRAICGPAFADVVSYPFGRPPHWDERVARFARDAGYAAGFTALPGVARPGDHLFTLPRLGMAPGVSALDAYELQGVSEAIDELLLVVTGSESRLAAELEG